MTFYTPCVFQTFCMKCYQIENDLTDVVFVRTHEESQWDLCSCITSTMEQLFRGGKDGVLLIIAYICYQFGLQDSSFPGGLVWFRALRETGGLLVFFSPYIWVTHTRTPNRRQFWRPDGIIQMLLNVLVTVYCLPDLHHLFTSQVGEADCVPSCHQLMFSLGYQVYVCLARVPDFSFQHKAFCLVLITCLEKADGPGFLLDSVGDSYWHSPLSGRDMPEAEESTISNINIARRWASNMPFHPDNCNYAQQISPTISGRLNSTMKSTAFLQTDRTLPPGLFL